MLIEDRTYFFVRAGFARVHERPYLPSLLVQIGPREPELHGAIVDFLNGLALGLVALTKRTLAHRSSIFYPAALTS